MDDINTSFCNHIIFSPFDQMKEKCNSATCDKTSEKFPITVGLKGTTVLHTPPQLLPINGGSASTSDLYLQNTGVKQAFLPSADLESAWGVSWMLRGSLVSAGASRPPENTSPAGWGFSTSVSNSAPREKEVALSPHASLPRPPRPVDPRAGGWRGGGMEGWRPG